MLRTLTIALVLLTVPLVGCIGADDLDDDQDLDENNVAGTDTVPIEELAVMDTPRSTFTELVCEGADAPPIPVESCLHHLSSLETGPANEVMVAMDKSRPNVLIAASKDYRALVPDCAVVSVYHTTDAGRTWEDGYPNSDPTPGPDGVEERCESDPVVAFDGRGNAVLETLDVEIGLFAYRTSDDGETWEEVDMAFEGFNDKNWMATDYRTGRIYSITRATCDGGQAVTWTDDAGDEWSQPVCFNGMDFGQIDVGPDGTVYAIGRVAGEGLGGPGAPDGGITFAKSTDMGQTWSEVETIAEATPMSALPVLGGHAYRTPALPDMAVSLGTGAIYAVWHDGALGDNQDVKFVASFDQGETWTDPVVVNDDDGPTGMADQFIPAVAASPAGDAHVIFFDARNDPTGDGNLLDVYYAHNPDPQAEADGFEENIRLTPVPFQPYTSKHQTQPVNIGDYIGLDASNEEAVAVFPTTYDGRSELFAAIVGGT